MTLILILFGIFNFVSLIEKFLRNDNEDEKRYAIDKSWNQHEKELRQAESVLEELSDIKDLNFARHNFKRRIRI